jgi:hypothetical protein
VKLSYEKAARKMLVKLTPRVDFINICARSAQDLTPFLANGVWQMAHKFGKFQLTSRANLDGLNTSEIKRQFFRQTLCAINSLLSEKSLVKSTLKLILPNIFLRDTKIFSVFCY